MHPLKTLVSGPIYCKKGNRQRAEVVTGLLRLVEVWTKSYPEASFLLVDNDVDHPEVCRLLRSMSASNLRVHRFSPQRYWSGARNHAVKVALEEGFDLLILIDDDITPPDDWIRRIIDVHEAHPEIEAGVVEDAESLPDLIGRIPLPQKRLELSLYREYLGNLNVMRRRALETVGGFREGEHFRYGFCDVEYGVRLLKAGFFDYAFGQYANPYGFKIEVRGKSGDKSDWIRRHVGYYHAVRGAVLDEVLPVYVDPETGLPAWQRSEVQG